MKMQNTSHGGTGDTETTAGEFNFFYSVYSVPSVPL